MRLTRAVTHHIRRSDAHHAQIAVLEALATEYLWLWQAYATYVCTEAEPDEYAAPCFENPRSQRWQRVAIQQGVSIAQSWGSNRADANQTHLDRLAEFQERHRPSTALPEPGAEPPAEVNDLQDELPPWCEWQTPVLTERVILANATIAMRQPSQESNSAYWLRLSTVEQGPPVWLSVRLATSYRQALAGRKVNCSTTLTRDPVDWWLTLSYDEVVPVPTSPHAPVVGVDVGIVHFLTTASAGRRSGTFHDVLALLHQRDREKRRRQAKLRACLKQQGLTTLRSTRRPKLARHDRQELHCAANFFSADHSDRQIGFEHLTGAGMHVKARRMNASPYAASLAHLPKQLAFGAATRGIGTSLLRRACNAQDWHRCDFVARANRPNRPAHCCAACGSTAHTDVHAAANLASQLHDQALATCTSWPANRPPSWLVNGRRLSSALAPDNSLNYHAYSGEAVRFDLGAPGGVS